MTQAQASARPQAPAAEPAVSASTPGATSTAATSSPTSATAAAATAATAASAAAASAGASASPSQQHGASGGGGVGGGGGGGANASPGSPPGAVSAAAAAAAVAGAELETLGGGAGAVVVAGQGSSKSRQKKFHRHFKTVAPEEHVLNYYSCALVGDILLQGHLYITKNYFAFYSNVFGYVTKLLIPTASVLKVSKEKTARIIPNAIGVATGQEKHVFGSLLSRDSTYKLMVHVWREAVAQGPKPLPVQVINEPIIVSGDLPLPDDEDSSSGSERSCPPTPIDCPTDMSHSEVGEGDLSPLVGGKVPNGGVKSVKHMLRVGGVSSSGARKIANNSGGALAALSGGTWAHHTAHLLLVSTGLLVLLFLSAAFLLYRIGRVQMQFSAADHPLSLTGSDDIYQEILKWQTQLHSRSANEVQEFLNTNLNQLAKVRQSLEALSLLIVTEEQHLQQQQRLQKEAEATASQHQQYQQQRHQQQQGAASLPHDRLS